MNHQDEQREKAWRERRADETRAMMATPPLTLGNWRERIGSLIQIALDTTFRERARLMGQGFALFHVAGTTRILVSSIHDPPDGFDKVLELQPSWGNDTALAHALDVMAKRPLPFGK